MHNLGKILTDDKFAEMTARLIGAGMEPENPPIGFAGAPDIPTLKGIKMRCTDVVLLASIESGEFIEFDRFLPYGFLKVEANELSPNTFVALIHKLDFKNAWDLRELGVFDDGYPTIELVYKPSGILKHIFPKVFPMFEFTLVGHEGIVGKYHGLKQEGYDGTANDS